jgi:hypothetical protein
MNLNKIIKFIKDNRCKINFQYLILIYVRIRSQIALLELIILCSLKDTIFYKWYLKLYMKNKIFERKTTLGYQDSKFSKKCGFIYAKQKDIERFLIFSYQKSKFYKVYYWTYYVEERRFEQKMVFKFKKTMFYKTLKSYVQFSYDFLYIMCNQIFLISFFLIHLLFDYSFIVLLFKLLQLIFSIIFNIIFKILLNSLNKIFLFFFKLLLKVYESKSILSYKKKINYLIQNSFNIFINFLKNLKERFSLIYKLFPIKLLLSYTFIIMFYLILILTLYLLLMNIPEKTTLVYTHRTLEYAIDIFDKFNEFIELQEFYSQMEVEFTSNVILRIEGKNYELGKLLEEIGLKKEIGFYSKGLEFPSIFSQLKKSIELSLEYKFNYEIEVVLGPYLQTYDILNSQKFLFVDNLKMYIYIFLALHSFFGVLNFLYDYFVKRIKGLGTMSLWVIYINMVIIIFYFLISVVLNLYFFFP